MTQDDVRSAALEWAIKDSLVSYVRAMKDGTVAVRLPAEEVAGGFRFPAAPHDSLDGSLRFAGCVRLSGHSGMLNLQFEDPWLVPGDASSDPWRLTIVDPYEPGERMVFALVAQVTPGTDGEGGVGDAGDGASDGGAGVRGAGSPGIAEGEGDSSGGGFVDSALGSNATLTTTGTTLTEDGADLFFSGPYLPGTEFDNPRVVAVD